MTSHYSLSYLRGFKARAREKRPPRQRVRSCRQVASDPRIGLRPVTRSPLRRYSRVIVLNAVFGRVNASAQRWGWAARVLPLSNRRRFQSSTERFEKREKIDGGEAGD